MAKNTNPAPAVVDQFDDATGADFVRIADVDGRALVAWCYEIGTEKGNDGNPYKYAQCEVVVLDGAEHEKFVPGELIDLRFTTPGIVRQMEKSKGAGRPRLGRVSSMKSRFGTRAYSLDPVETDDPVRARLAEALDVRTAAKMAEASGQVDSGDPFAS